MLSDQQKDGLSQEQQEEFEKEKEGQLNEIDAEIDTQKQLDNQNLDRIQNLLQLARRSLDEERDKSTYFSDKAYQKDFIPNKEASNTVSSIMSAMVTQIAAENKDHSMMNESKLAEESTEPESLDDLFDHYHKEIEYDTNLAEREPPDEEFSMQ